jgi:hypothetical protein
MTMITKAIYVICILVCVTVGVLVVTSYNNLTALEVRDTTPSTLKVVESKSEVINGRMILQPASNPQR